MAPSRSNAVAVIAAAKVALPIGACLTGDHQMRSVRFGWQRALSARRLVLLATVAGLGAAGAAIGPNALHQNSLPTYAAADAAESAQRPVGFADPRREGQACRHISAGQSESRLRNDEFQRRDAVSERLTDGAVLPALRIT